MPHLVHKYRVTTPLIALLVLLIAACKPNAPAAAETAQAATSAPPLADAGCGKDGALRADLFGSIETHIDWSGSDLECDSMRRPDDAGIRLRFAGDVAGERLSLILALPALRQGEAALESPTNFTLTVEGSGRFFSTPNLATCWTDIAAAMSSPDNENRQAISGTVYCVAPLGQVNGDSAVSVPELAFSTLVDWDGS